MFKRLALNTIVQILGKAVMVVVSLFTTGLLTRKLGIAIYGQYILISSLSIFFDALADFGTSVIGVREAAKESEEKGRRRVWSNVAILRLIMAFFSLGLGIVIINLWPDLKEIKMETMLAWVMLVFTSLAGSLGIVWQTRMKMEVKVIVEVFFPTIFLICLWIFKGEISLIWVFSTYLISRIITLIWAWWWASGAISFKLIDWKLIKELAKMSWPMGLYLLVFSAYDRAIDSLMIRRILGINEVAWYGLAYKIYGVLVQPAYFLVSGIFPVLSVKKDDKKLFGTLWWILLIAALLVVLIGWITAPLMISVLAGSGFVASVGILRILLIALIFSYLGHLVGFTLISKEGQREMLGLGLITLIFNFAGNLLIIPHYGIIGAAVVTVFTEAISLLLMSLRLKRR